MEAGKEVEIFLITSEQVIAPVKGLLGKKDIMISAFKEMEESKIQKGQTVLTLTGWAKKRLEDLTPEGHLATLHVSLTDDHPWAHAIVIIDAQPLA